MQLADIVKALDLAVFTDQPLPEGEIRLGYVSDLLSDVLGHAPAGALWVTLQSHPNVVAVASLVGLSGVILSGGTGPDPRTLEQAAAVGVTLLGSSLPAFELVGRLYQLGIVGFESAASRRNS